MKSDKQLRAVGHACIYLTPEIKKVIKNMETDEILEVFNDDPASRLGVPAWCRLTGNELLDVQELNNLETLFYIQRKKL